MINIDFVNDSIDLEHERLFHSFNKFMESCKKEIDNMYADFSIIEEKAELESYILGSPSEKLSVLYEDGKANIFTKIGEMVVTICQKFVELVESIIDKIKSLSFKNKKAIQKLDILLKNHPELKDEEITDIRDAFYNGALNLNDVKSLKELDDTFNEILKMMKEKEVDPDSLKGKWLKAKKKFVEDSEKLEKGVKTVGGIITAVLALKTFLPNCMRAENNLREEKQKSNAAKAKIMSELEKEGKIDENTGKWTLMLQIWREWHGMHSKVVKLQDTATKSLADKVLAFIDKHDKKAANGGSVRETLNTINDRNKKSSTDKED